MSTTEHSAEYQAYMASDAWTTRKAPILARAQGCCERCRQPVLWLEVHHWTYERLGAERDDDLAALCRPCHIMADADRRGEHSWPQQIDQWARQHWGADWSLRHSQAAAEQGFIAWVKGHPYGY